MLLGDVRGREFDGVARVQKLRARRLQLEHVVQGQGHPARERLLERGPLRAVEHRVVGAVLGSVGLVARHHPDKRLPAHRLQRVVRSPLLPQRRERLRADRLPAERPGSVRRVDEAFVRQREELRVQRIEQHSREGRRGPTERSPQIGPTHVADEQGVAGERGVRLRLVGVQVVDDEEIDSGVGRRFQDFQANASESDDGAVADGVNGTRPWRKRRGRSSPRVLGELQIPRRNRRENGSETRA